MVQEWTLSFSHIDKEYNTENSSGITISESPKDTTTLPTQSLH
jgi:hypothetical protein